MTTSIRAHPLAWVAVSICAAHAMATLLLEPGPFGSGASNLLQVAAAMTAALSSLGASRRATGFARRFWTLVSISFWIWSTAQATYAYQENWIGVDVPQPSWTHFLFRLYGAPLLIALIIGHEDEEKRRGPDWQQVLDSAQVGILFLFFYFDLYFVPGGDWQGLTGLSLGGFFDLSDVENWALCAAFLGRARLSRRFDVRTASWRMVPYLFCYAVSSSGYNYKYAFSQPQTGEWPDLVFTFSLGVGSLLAATWQPYANERPFLTGSITAVNWVPAVLPLLTLALALPMARSEPGVAFVAVFGSVACFGARLVITLYRRQRLMEDLRASEARYASLLRLAPDAIFVHVGGRITFANAAAARTVGVDSPEDLVGMSVLELVPPEARAELARELGSLTGETVVKRLMPIVRRDGVLILVDMVGSSLEPTPGESGLPSRLVIARDVTERERAQAERESLIRELEAKNAELERFTYTVSHDLRSPLITITGFLSHVEEAGARGDMVSLRSDVERIRRAATRMSRLLEDLLELSRTGHVLASPASFPFGALVQEAVDLVGGRLTARNITVEVEPDLPLIHGDRARLVEVVQNLLDNAAKFMGDQQAPRIQIGARKDERGTILFVRDNGIGIDPQHHERVFRLFDRLDAKAEGTGVGLALVKRIIELHGGRIWVESDGRGTGAAFCFTLPAAPDSPTEVG